MVTTFTSAGAAVQEAIFRHRTEGPMHILAHRHGYAVAPARRSNHDILETIR